MDPSMSETRVWSSDIEASNDAFKDAIASSRLFLSGVDSDRGVAG